MPCIVVLTCTAPLNWTRGAYDETKINYIAWAKVAKLNWLERNDTTKTISTTGGECSLPVFDVAVTRFMSHPPILVDRMFPIVDRFEKLNRILGDWLAPSKTGNYLLPIPSTIVFPLPSNRQWFPRRTTWTCPTGPRRQSPVWNI